MSHSQQARQMLRAHRYGALGTLSKKFDGHPFGSITPYLVDHDGSLLILISTLAEHTKNIQFDPRVSLITHDQRSPHIQSQGRVTLVGTAQLVTDREQTGSRYLRYFPEAHTYLAMHDFSFYRIQPLSIRFIGGFGNIHWVQAENYLLPDTPLAGEEAAIIAQINSEHGAALRLCCQRLSQAQAPRVEMIGLDCDGFDVRADDEILRFDFTAVVSDAQQARQAFLEISGKNG